MISPAVVLPTGFYFARFRFPTRSTGQQERTGGEDGRTPALIASVYRPDRGFSSTRFPVYFVGITVVSDTLYKDHGLVFASMVGTRLSHHNLTRAFKAALRRAGLPQTFRFHNRRHTCATLLLSRGHHATFVQELVGHANIAIALDTYSHVLPGMADHTAAMEDALS